MASNRLAFDPSDLFDFCRKAPDQGLLALHAEQPGIKTIRAIADAARERVRVLEEQINRPNFFCTPVHLNVGEFEANGVYEDSGNWYALGIARAAGRWRVVVYRWVQYSRGTNDDRGASKPQRKPWLEASVTDRIATLANLPDLFKALNKSVVSLAHRAGDCGEAVDKLDRLVRDAKAWDQLDE